MGLTQVPFQPSSGLAFLSIPTNAVTASGVAISFIKVGSDSGLQNVGHHLAMAALSIRASKLSLP